MQPGKLAYGNRFKLAPDIQKVARLLWLRSVNIHPFDATLVTSPTLSRATNASLMVGWPTPSSLQAGIPLSAHQASSLHPECVASWTLLFGQPTVPLYVSLVALRN